MIDVSKANTIFIGRRGEHHFRNIEFDVSSLLAGSHSGESLHAIYKRPDGETYPVVTSYSNGVLTWSPSAADTDVAGVGKLEIRVMDGEVVGKSARVLTVVEDALADGSISPPDPPAQEWLNKVLAALSALDVDKINSLLNLTYNLLSDNHSLLGTTHALLNDTRDTLFKRTGILLNHMHPIETATAPDMVSRRAALTFTSISAGNSVNVGGITYNFVSALGSPSANTVQVRVQGTLRDSVKMLAKAIMGNVDEANIAYGSDMGENPYCTAYWTSQRFSIGETTVAAGESLFMLEKAENAVSPIALSTTAGAVVYAFTRAAFSRYVLSGNVSGSGGANSVRGPMHTILPAGSVVVGGQEGMLYPASYDCHQITLCRQSDTSEKELDFYISNDEETFTRIQRSVPIGSNTSAESLHIHIQLRQVRVPAGYGLYIRMGSDGTSSTAFCDLKFTYHLYPADLTTSDCGGL